MRPRTVVVPSLGIFARRERVPRREADGGGATRERERVRMIFTETDVAGAYVIDLEKIEDDRGFFARAFCQNEFAEHGLNPVIAQANIAFNVKQGTLRGMHFQFPPAPETEDRPLHPRRDPGCHRRFAPRKVPRICNTISVELSEDNHRALDVPECFAHGYQVLRDKTETSYQVGECLHTWRRGRLDVQRPPA